MRRISTSVALAALLTLAGPGLAMAQTKEEPPSGGTGTVEPVQAWYMDVAVAAILVDGAEVDRVPLGRPAQLRFSAKNASDKPASDVTVTLEAPANATLTDRSLSFGDIAPQTGADATTTIEITSDKDCQGFLGWVGTLRSSLGEQMVKFGVSVECPGPRLSIERWEFVGGDGDEMPEPGETLQIFLTYRNEGRDPATDVRATLTTASRGVTVTDAHSSFGTVAPRTSQRATDPFTIEIASDAPVQTTKCEGVPVQEGPPATAEDMGSSSDGTVSSDGSTSGGGSGEGSSGTPSETTVAPEPGSTEPDPNTKEAPSPRPAPDERVAPSEPSVAIDAQLKVTSAEISFDDTFSNQMVCMMMDDTRGAPIGGVGAPEADGAARDLLAAGATSSGERSGSIALAIVLLAAVGSQVAWRLMRARATLASAPRR